METAELKSLIALVEPRKIFDAHLSEPSYEVSVHDIHWAEPGAIQLLSGKYCLVELADISLTGKAPYVIETDDGRRLPTGRLNFMPPGSRRTIRWQPGHHRTAMCVMDPQQLGLLGSAGWRWSEVDPALTIDVDNPRLRSIMRWLADEIATPAFAGELQISSLLTMLAIELHRHCAVGCPEERIPGCLSGQQLNLLRDLIEASENPKGPTLADLANACQRPARELSAMFKRTAGQTLRSYVASRHIERAKVLLADPDLLVKQVAYRSGFCSAAAFADAFRRATGVTPQQFRHQLDGSRRGRLTH